jgi:hypothetical protein
MNTFFTEVRQTLVPRGEVKHGPLPTLLVAMTLVTGLVDAFSYLVLGHVFVANMTGNVVFLAFAQFDSVILTATGKRLSIRTKGNTPNLSRSRCAIQKRAPSRTIRGNV